MSNPAPTLNQINAFNATQGTTIDFNIIGGTEVIRSNKIYIYDLSDNSLICTHLYVSTESIHELPPNTSSSIIYASGKSSADFTNNTQYYAQIQTFTDVGGTQGGSGLSIAKLFWCLPTPTLTLSTIPTTISTTSYNVSATYTDTSASVVSNIIQQYQFNLYNATGSLLQSSGVVVGSGMQQGTSDVYDISYNFTGLNVGNSYYVTMEVTTTQGMSVSAQSNTFTVSIDTPTLGEATVVNNACDGYISVTSNLSGEYGGSASGEIASFVTNSINNVSSLKVSLDPVQDLHGYDKPWVGGAGKNKLNEEDFSSGQVSVSDGIFSNTVVDTRTSLALYARLFRSDGTFDTVTIGLVSTTGIKTVTFTASDDFVALGVLHSGSKANIFVKFNNCNIVAGRQYTFSLDVISTNPSVVGGFSFKHPQLEEGSTATAYAPYSNICPITGWTGCEVDVANETLWNEQWELGGINATTGEGDSSTDRFRSKDFVPCKEGTSYYFNCPSANWRMFFYDANKTFKSYIGTYNSPRVITIPSGVAYLKFWIIGTTYANDISINYPSTDTNYNAHNPNSAVYPVSWQTEAGTVYGGTVDVVSGVLTVTPNNADLGTLNWVYVSSGNYFYAVISDKAKGFNNIKCSAYEVAPQAGVANLQNGQIVGGMNDTAVYVKDSRYTDAVSFKAGVSGYQLVYELATPQTYQLTPTQIQTLVGVNNVWSDAGEVEVTYNIPITNLLVKRQDVADVSGAWLTLYSQPITQASDMDFTFIDFTNQYGKTYKYALVPLLTQIQSGVEVEIEGGYTVSDNVDSIFDGVYIADQTNVERVKAGVGYGNVDMNQGVGSITPIGSKYPIVITNSQNQYHNGSIRGTIVPNDFYSNGNLSRIDMVNKRDELEQFLTNKRAKIIKDWNGKMWLVMIMSNVSCSFDDNYGMGMVSFSADWLEVGDPTNQQDLYNAGLISVGGV